jgi:hypothetical protein
MASTRSDKEKVGRTFALPRKKLEHGRMRFLSVLLILVFAQNLLAQPGLPTPVPKKKPVSVSYETVTKCFPMLEDSRLSFRVDLRILLEKIDSVYTTNTNKLLMRVLHFREGTGVLRRVTLDNVSGTGLKQTFTPIWETLTDSGTVEPWEGPLARKTPLTMSEINAVVGRGVIERDENLYLATKFNGLKQTLRKDLTKILELRLEEPNVRTLVCEDKKDFGAICTCRKK